MKRSGILARRCAKARQTFCLAVPIHPVYILHFVNEAKRYFST
nr:MAG TPA: hypothetical protein [Microviridae sp.]